ncbi:MAG: hypothetical protein H8D45_13410 [Bacteroidetes bacterium]|nr:hypothetical protein [Bacteroidota bacterium]
MKIPFVVLAVIIVVLLSIKSNQSEEDRVLIIDEVTELFEEIELMKLNLSQHNLELLNRLKKEYSQLDSATMNNENEELILIKKTLQGIKNEVSKPTTYAQVEKYADFTKLPANNKSSKEIKASKIKKSGETGPVGQMIEIQARDRDVEFHRGNIPELNIQSIQCSLSVLIKRYKLLMVIEDLNNDYFLFDPVENNLQKLEPDILAQFSDRGYRQYYNQEEKEWKRKAEIKLSSKIADMGWAWPKSSEEILIHRQLEYCKSKNVMADQVSITSGYYDQSGTLILTSMELFE